MSYKSYDMIKIVSSIAVAGGVLTYIITGSLNFFRGEVVAEMMAGMLERREIPSSGFNNTFNTNDNNTVDSFLRRSQIQYIQNELISSMFSADKSGSNTVYWCDARTIPSGDFTISSADVEMSIRTNTANVTYWNYTTPSNATTDVIFMLDRVYDSSMNYNPTSYVDQIIGVDQFYTSVAGYSNAVNGAFNWWNYAGLGTNTYQFTYPDYFVRTNEINEIVNLCTNLNCTVLFIDPNDLDYQLSRNFIYGNVVTNETYNGDWDYYDINDVVSKLQLFQGSFDSVTTNSGSWGGVLGTLGAEGYVYGNQQYNWNGSGWDLDTQYSFMYSSSFSSLINLTGCSIPYPSTNAFLYGYVKKIRTYACTVSDVCTRLTTNSGWTATIDSSEQPNFYEDKLFGVADVICELPTSPTIPDGNHVFDNPNVFNSYKTIKLELLHTANNPSTRPTFNIIVGTSFGSATLSDYTRLAQEKEFIDVGVEKTNEKRDDINFDNQIIVEKLVVIIEWDFNHMNPDSIYSP